ncbi:MAG: hypothetical protein HFE45_02730 [Oscillospiraceae bacterium]|nr:hypothetical protein [Oscillospiraceae bacterium]
MSRNDPTIDQILRELEQQGDPKKPSSSVDALVEELVEELLQEQSHAGIDPASGEELPTRVFLRPKKKRPAASLSPSSGASVDQLLQQLAAGREAPAEPVKPLAGPAASAGKGPAPSAVPKRPEPPKSIFSSMRRAAPPETPRQEPAPEPPKQPERQAVPSPERPQPEAYAYTTGPISIDIDAIRAGAPPPREIPAQKMPEEPAAPKKAVEPAPEPPPPRRPKPRPPAAEERPFKPSSTRAVPAASRPAPPSEHAAAAVDGRIPIDEPPSWEQESRRAGKETPAKAAPCFRAAIENNKGDPEAILNGICRTSSLQGWVLFLLFCFSAVLLVLMERSRAQQAGWAPSFTLMGMLLALALGAGGIVLPMVGGGLWSLVRLEPNRDSLPALCWLAATAQTAALTIRPMGFIHPAIHCYLPVGILALMFGCIGRVLTGKGALKGLSLLRQPGDKYVPYLARGQTAAVLMKGLPEGGSLPAANRKTAAVADIEMMFLAADSSDSLGRKLSLLGLGVGAAAALAGFVVTRQKHFALMMFTLAIALFAPASAYLCTACPFSQLAGRTAKEGGMICGELAAERYRSTGAVLMDVAELIPPSAVKMAAIKTFEGARIDQALVDAASVLQGSGSLLTELFGQALGGLAPRAAASSVELIDGQGVVGWLEDRRVLLGNREMMAAYQIKAPSAEYEKRFTDKGRELLYLASGVELAAIFVLTFHPLEKPCRAVQSLTDGGSGLLLTVSDGFLTAGRLARLLDVDPRQIKVLPQKLRAQAERISGEVRVKQAVAVNDGSPSGFAALLTACQRLQTLAVLNRVLAATAAGLGCLLLLIFWTLGALPQLTMPILCGYALVWPILSFGFSAGFARI